MVAVSVHIDGDEPVSLKLRKRKYTSATLLDALREKLGTEVEWNADCDVPLQQLHKDANGVVDLHVCSNNMSIDDPSEHQAVASDEPLLAQATVNLDGEVPGETLQLVEADKPEATPMVQDPPALLPVAALDEPKPMPRMRMTQETWW